MRTRTVPNITSNLVWIKDLGLYDEMESYLCIVIYIKQAIAGSGRVQIGG